MNVVAFFGRSYVHLFDLKISFRYYCVWATCFNFKMEACRITRKSQSEKIPRLLVVGPGKKWNFRAG